MMIQTNDNGTIRKPHMFQANDGGTMRELEQIVANDGGVIREIFSRPRTGQLIRKNRFLTESEGAEEGLVRCDGRPLFEEGSLTDLLKSPHVGYELGGLPNRNYRQMSVAVVGDKVYMGGDTTATEIVVWNWKTNAFSGITGLPNRAHHALCVVDTRIFVATRASVNTMLVIDTETDTFESITLPGSYSNLIAFGLFGDKAWFGPNGTNGSRILVVDTNDYSVTEVNLGVQLNIWRFVQVREEVFLGLNNSINNRIISVNINTLEVTVYTTPADWPNAQYTNFFRLENMLLLGSHSNFGSSGFPVLNLETKEFEFIPTPQSTAYSEFFLTETKLYMLSWTFLTTAIGIIDLDNPTAVREIRLPERATNQRAVAWHNNKLYLANSSQIPAIYAIDTVTDTVITIPTHHQSKADGRLVGNSIYYRNGTNIPAGTNVICTVVNTDDDTVVEINRHTSQPTVAQQGIHRLGDNQVLIQINESRSSMIVAGEIPIVPDYPQIPMYIQK